MRRIKKFGVKKRFMTNDCVSHAINAYVRRARIDSNPKILRRLTLEGRPDSHRYYLSDQVVSTSEFDWDGRTLSRAFEEPIGQAPKEVRGCLEKQ